MKIKDLLKKYKALTPEIVRTDYHMSLLNVDTMDLKRRIPALAEKKDQELVAYIAAIYRRCDSDNPEYDSKLDEEMVRLALRTDKFNGGRPDGMISDDVRTPAEEGVWEEITSIYDDVVDAENDRLHK